VLQVKLLRVIQERIFERVGGTRSIEADVRWIAATNRDLTAMVADGSFREDLYHRLAVFPLELPALRERAEDIIPLAESLLLRIGAALGKRGLSLTPAARVRLVSYDWPGNVRALGNALERAAILTDSTTIDEDHLLLGPTRTTHPQQVVAPLGSQTTLAELERQAIVDALSQVGGNRRKAAKALGIGLRTLYEKIKRFEIE
jgi:two-component system response regulator FlrC